MIYKLAPFIMITAIFLMITLIVINLIRYRLKKKMIETGIIEEPIIGSETDKPKAERRSALKWALIMMFGGLGLVVQEFSPYSSDNSALPYGLEIIFISIGLFIYYLIIKKDIPEK
ncbi:DUF6249 domain-containing protein [Pedobacter sp. WC2423]|uniref:DUF6249 domain-containing protein n=1 Tax=Pedobacter sp. WC2423 TaxID=3234142 RepID=UPI003467E516